MNPDYCIAIVFKSNKAASSMTLSLLLFSHSHVPTGKEMPPMVLSAFNTLDYNTYPILFFRINLSLYYFTINNN